MRVRLLLLCILYNAAQIFMFSACKKEQIIHVAPAFTHTIVNDNFTVPVKVNFVNASSGATKYLWTFEGGEPTKSVQKDPGTIIFSTAGAHTVTLEAWNEDERQTKTTVIQLDSAVQVAFNPIVQINNFLPVSVAIENQTVGASNYAWTFEGGSPAASMLKDPGIITFSTAGSHNITLVASNGRQHFTIAKTITILPALVTDFDINPSFDDDDFQVPFSAVLKNTSVSGLTWRWSNGATTEVIANLKQGNYLAFVKDAHGCETQQQATVASPGLLAISNPNVIQPTCSGSTNGAVSYDISGGVEPYNIKWNNGTPTQSLNQIGAGIYTVIVSDQNNCADTMSFTLKDPAAIEVNLGTEHTLCKGQVYNADATIANGSQYRWNSANGFFATTAKVALEKAGVYQVTATDNNGCTGTGEVRIDRSEADINVRFTGTTQAFTGEDVVFVNISQPQPEKIAWSYPAGIQTIQEKEEMLTLRFSDTGLYIIQMKGTEGACVQTIMQPITIVPGSSLSDPGSTTAPFIMNFYVAPNPSNGQFNAIVNLQEKAEISLKLVDITHGAILDQRKASGNKEYKIPYQVTLSSGTYALVLETAKGSRVFKIVIL